LGKVKHTLKRAIVHRIRNRNSQFMLHKFSSLLEKLSIVLASQSPRRAAILRENLGLNFNVVVSGFAENLDKALFKNPSDYVSNTARLKAESVADSFISSTSNNKADFIISADTIVVFDNIILEKPENDEGAKTMLKMLSGNMMESPP
jgi:septum formation protein